MSGNEDRDSSSFSESIRLRSLSSGRSVQLAISDQEEHSDDRAAGMDTTPPLGVKLTGYRLVFMTTVFSFGTIKTILTYMGQSIAPTTLDWVSGTLLTIALYWISLYEESNKWKWFFQVDFAPAIGYCLKCWAVLMWHSDSLLIFLNLMLSFLTGYLYAHNFYYLPLVTRTAASYLYLRWLTAILAASDLTGSSASLRRERYDGLYQPL